jgi:putative DNA primase/helicase
MKEKPNLKKCTISLNELLKMDIPERKRILPWLPEGGLAMVYGPRGIGKTYFSLSLACSLAVGTPFLKWDAPPPTGTLIIDGEMPVSELRERILRLLKEKPIKPLEILSGEQVFLGIERDLNLAKPEFQESVLDLLDAKLGIKAVIVDNISCLFMGIKESDKNDWEKVIPWLLKMRRRGIATILIHHAGKSGDQRGTSGREDILDTTIKLGKRNLDNDGARFEVHFTKNRGAFGKDVEAFEAVLNFNAPSAWTWKPLTESNFDKMIDLAKDGIDSVKDMADELGISKGMVSRLKKKGIQQGILKQGSKITPVDD